MKKIISSLILASTLVGTSAFASCPEIEGKYNYTCTVEKDSDAEFAKALDVSGTMLVHQKGCESYQFANQVTQIEEEFLLADVETNDEANRAKIGKSTANVIKFKTISRETNELGLPLVLRPDGLTREVTKGVIRKTKKGFTLKGKERSRVLAIFMNRHSKFNCKFTEQN